MIANRYSPTPNPRRSSSPKMPGASRAVVAGFGSTAAPRKVKTMKIGTKPKTAGALVGTKGINVLGEGT
jgi:hypothetical protein